MSDMRKFMDQLNEAISPRTDFYGLIRAAKVMCMDNGVSRVANIDMVATKMVNSAKKKFSMEDLIEVDDYLVNLSDRRMEAVCCGSGRSRQIVQMIVSWMFDKMEDFLPKSDRVSSTQDEQDNPEPYKMKQLLCIVLNSLGINDPETRNKLLTIYMKKLGHQYLLELDGFISLCKGKDFMFSNDMLEGGNDILTAIDRYKFPDAFTERLAKIASDFSKFCSDGKWKS